MSTYDFDCGCKFKVLDDKVKECDGLPSLSIDFNNLSHDCESTWDLFSSGKTKGVFQLENSLGKHWSKQVKPTSIEDISALVSIIRPGSLKSIVDGKSTTQRYVDRKHGREKVEYIHPALEKILSATYGNNIYQESSIAIATAIAGFDLQEADALRRGIGKKSKVIINSLKQTFIDGCNTVGLVNEEQAKELFANIEESNRYSFNKCISLNTVVKKFGVQNYVKITEIKVGDKVLCPTADGKQRYETVKAIHHNGVKQLFTATFNDYTPNKLPLAYFIECTLDHKFMCANGDFSLNSMINRGFSDTVINIHGREVKLYSVTLAKKEQTIDLEIDSDLHMFFANNLAVSNSHGVGYGEISYWTAYVKAHFPLHFCCSYLYYAREKMKPQEEIDEIITDAKNLDIDILTPDIRYLFNGDAGDFALNSMKINFGVRSIKGCGDKNIEKLLAIVTKGEQLINKSIHEWTWLELLLLALTNVSKTVVNGLISVGGCSHFGLSRQKMLHEYAVASDLNEKELSILVPHCSKFSTLEECLNYLESSGGVKKQRLEKINKFKQNLLNPPFSLDDSPNWIAEKEQFYLGYPLSCMKVESINISGNTTCKEFNNGKDLKVMNVVGEIKSTREFVLKKGNSIGKKMCFGTIQDPTSCFDYALSPEKYEELRNVAYKGNIVMMTGKRSKNGNFQVERMVTVE